MRPQFHRESKFCAKLWALTQVDEELAVYHPSSSRKVVLLSLFLEDRFWKWKGDWGNCLDKINFEIISNYRPAFVSILLSYEAIVQRKSEILRSLGIAVWPSCDEIEPKHSRKRSKALCWMVSSPGICPNGRYRWRRFRSRIMSAWIVDIARRFPFWYSSYMLSTFILNIALKTPIICNHSWRQHLNYALTSNTENDARFC